MKKNRITEWNTLPVVLDTATVALIWGVSINTVKNWIRDGRIKSIQINRQHFFDREYVKSLTSQQEDKK